MVDGAGKRPTFAVCRSSLTDISPAPGSPALRTNSGRAYNPDSPGGGTRSVLGGPSSSHPVFIRARSAVDLQSIPPQILRRRRHVYSASLLSS